MKNVIIKYRGQYTFYPGDRIFESILKIVHIMDAVLVAMEFVRASDPVAKSKIPDGHLLASESFNVEIGVPTKTLMEYLAKNELARFVQITVLHSNPQRFSRIRTVSGALFLTGLLTPIFVDFFEQHVQLLKNKFGGDPNQTWPPIANFVRVIRNFIVHHQGRVGFDNPNAPPISWHHLIYEPKDKGYMVVGYNGDIGLGDLILLLMEFAGELDDWGCPPLTMTLPPLETLARERRQNPDNPEYRALATKYGLQPPSRL